MPIGAARAGLLSSRDAIPDSGVYQYEFGQRSNSTLKEEIQGADGTANNGLANVSGTWVGDAAEDGDGTDDYGSLTDLTEANFIANNIDGTFSILVTVQTTETSSSTIIGAYDQPIELQLSLNNNSSNETEFRLQDATDNRGIVSGSTAINDGNKYRISFIKRGNDPSTNWEIWINGSEDTVTEESGLSRFGHDGSSLSYPVYSHALNRGGSIEQYANATIDNIILCETDLSSTEVSDDYNSQPWS